MRKETKLKIIIVAIVFLIIGFFIGFTIGSMQTLNLCIETGEKLLNITLDPEAISALSQRFPEIKRWI